jgi:hypothetical protein
VQFRKIYLPQGLILLQLKELIKRFKGSLVNASEVHSSASLEYDLMNSTSLKDTQFQAPTILEVGTIHAMMKIDKLHRLELNKIRTPLQK